MSKPLLVFQGPVGTRSGYGDHARSLLQSIRAMDRFEVKIVPTQWGNTPQNYLSPEDEFGQWALSNIIVSLDKKPDVYVQVTVANEFNPIGKYNIGVTAGVETTAAPQNFIEGCNKMDLIVVPSEFTKKTLLDTSYSQVDRRTNETIKIIKIEKPIEVLFEGVDLNVYSNSSKNTNLFDELNNPKIPDFNFLFVGHWLTGDLGEDRKNVGMMIKTFAATFKSFPKDKQPGLLLKTSMAGFSVGDRNRIEKRIKKLTDEFGDKCPPITLIFGDLTDDEMNDLYFHPKSKAMVMFTKGEGYGRPLAEFATTGKPIIVSQWSGYLDFLPDANTVYVNGELTNVHESAANDFLIKEGKWFTINYSSAARKLMDVFNNYKKYSESSSVLKSHIANNFSQTKMQEDFKKIFDKYHVSTEFVELQLPVLKKV